MMNQSNNLKMTIAPRFQALNAIVLSSPIANSF